MASPGVSAAQAPGGGKSSRSEAHKNRRTARNQVEAAMLAAQRNHGTHTGPAQTARSPGARPRPSGLRPRSVQYTTMPSTRPLRTLRGQWLHLPPISSLPRPASSRFLQATSSGSPVPLASAPPRKSDHLAPPPPRLRPMALGPHPAGHQQFLPLFHPKGSAPSPGSAYGSTP